MPSKFLNRSLISITDFSKEEILSILKRAEECKKSPQPPVLQGRILASCFFEPSTRTRLSFEAAAFRLGANVVGFTDPDSTSIKKGESLHDAIKVIGQYADIIVLRHPLEGAARLALQATDKPIINAGDGSNQHPTQTLLDLFTIKECQRKLNGLHIALVGDLKHGRTIHSLALACALFDIRLYFVSSDLLTLPETICQQLKKMGVKFSFHRTCIEILNKLDILYMTRLQSERLGLQPHEEIKHPCLLKEEQLKGAKKNLKILHPLPRVNEIEYSIDKTPHAYYFQQAENGLYVRQALLGLILGAKKWSH